MKQRERGREREREREIAYNNVWNEE
jgi:hypothetical protein